LIANMPPALPAQGEAAAAPSTQRPTCPRCRRPQASCLCRWITPTDNQVSLLILQHPREQHQAKGSARLLQLSLGRCEVALGEAFDPAALAGWLAAPTAAGSAHNLLLYPDPPGSVAPTGPAVQTGTPLARPTAWRLVLLDGTWRQSRRLLQANPLLRALPRWALPSLPPSRYRIRRAQRPEQRSSLEAACLALAALEGEAARYAPLLAAFDDWVASVAARAPEPRRGAPFTAA
jgi:DTW domain-containing protein YfiP